MQFVRVLDGNGGSYPFLVQTEAGQLLVVRAKKALNAKNLFSEYVARNLACQLGLIKEPAQLVFLPPEVLTEMEKRFPEKFDRNASAVVAMDFIPDLQKAFFPKAATAGVEYSSKEERSRIRKYILDFFPNKERFEEFYGFFLFAHWTLMNDLKFEQLHKGVDGRVVFLDFDGSFGALWEWDCSRLIYMEEAFRIEGPAFTEGVLDDISRFDMWYERLKTLPEEECCKMIRGVPAEWEVPLEFTEKLIDLLFGKKHWFLETFQNYMSWRIKNGCL